MRHMCYLLMLFLCLVVWESAATAVGSSAQTQTEETTAEAEDDTTTSTEEPATTAASEDAEKKNDKEVDKGLPLSNAAGVEMSSTAAGGGAGSNGGSTDLKDNLATDMAQMENRVSITSTANLPSSPQSTPSSTEARSDPVRSPVVSERGPTGTPGPQGQVPTPGRPSDPHTGTGHSSQSSEATRGPNGERNGTPSPALPKGKKQDTNIDAAIVDAQNIGSAEEGRLHAVPERSQRTRDVPEHKARPQTKLPHGTVTIPRESPPLIAITDTLTNTAEDPHITTGKGDAPATIVRQPGTDTKFDSTAATPQMTKDMTSLLTPKDTSTDLTTSLSTVSQALPPLNSVDKTDVSLGSSSLFALAALATLAVAAAAPAH